MSKNHPSPIIRLYLVGQRIASALFMLPFACHTGFWLGVFGRDSLDRLNQYYYDHDSVSLDNTYNRSGLFGWEAEAMRKYFSDSKSVFVIAAGGGREVIALRKMGYDADGCDCNQQLVQYAQGLLAEEGLPPCIQWSPPSSCSDLTRRYDGFIIGWGAYGHIPGSQRVELLKSIRDSMREHSPVLLSFLPRCGSRRMDRLTIWIANVIRKTLGREPATLGDRLTPGYMHIFAMEEIQHELAEAGFTLVSYGDSDYGHAVAIS